MRVFAIVRSQGSDLANTLGEVCPLQSGLIIEIPEAETAVAEPRLRLDRVAALGVPAHVTALFPFVSPQTIDEETLDRVAEVAAAQNPFDYAFSTTAWFGKEVLYLAPDDPIPFIRLTEALWNAFPQCPPYGGQYEDVIPHLTIGEGAEVEALHDAEAFVLSHGSVYGYALRLTLMAEATDRTWSRIGSCALGVDPGFIRV